MNELKLHIRELIGLLRLLLDVELKTGQPMDDGDRNEILELLDEIEQLLE